MTLGSCSDDLRGAVTGVVGRFVTADRDMARGLDAFRNVAAGALVQVWSAGDDDGTIEVSKTNSQAPQGEAGFEVFCGIDVAREMHHAVALNGAGERLVDRPLRNAESDLIKLFTDLQGHGRVLVVVDQLASIGALAIAVARSRGIAVAYLPGLAMRRIADLYPGEGKTDARDAYVIADAARTLPHALRRAGRRSRPPSSWPCWPGTTPTWRSSLPV